MTPVSDTQIRLAWTTNTTTGTDYFFATTNGTDPKECEVASNWTGCTINGLTPMTVYEVSLWVCDAKTNSTSRTCHDPPNTVFTKTLPSGRFKEVYCFCSTCRFLNNSNVLSVFSMTPCRIWLSVARTIPTNVLYQGGIVFR